MSCPVIDSMSLQMTIVRFPICTIQNGGDGKRLRPNLLLHDDLAVEAVSMVYVRLFGINTSGFLSVDWEYVTLVNKERLSYQFKLVLNNLLFSGVHLIHTAHEKVNKIRTYGGLVALYGKLEGLAAAL